MKRKKNAFSLVELLAVIIVLGIIASIIIPSTLKTLDKSKKDSFESSVVGLIKAASNYMAESDFEDWTSGLTITNIQTNNLFETKNVNIFTSGTLYNNNGTITVINVTDGNYCANGKKNSLTITKGNCVTGNDIIYEIDTINLRDFSNWKSGNYNWTTGAYEVYPARLCLNNHITGKPSTTYKVTISNTSYRVLIRALDSNHTFISSFDLSNNGTFITPSNTTYLAISIYNPTLSTLTYDTYKNLFESGFKVDIIKQ